MLLKKPKKIFHNIFSPKRALFAVFLAVLVLGISFLFTKTSHADFKMSEAEKAQFSSIIKGKSTRVKTQTDMDNLISAYEKNYNSFNDVKNYLIDTQPTDTVAASLNQFSGKAALQGLADGFSELVIAVVIGVLSIIAAFCKQFVSMGAETLDFALNPNLYSFTSNAMIVQGWVMVRDICNLFFLLVLLFISICTILKIGKYHAKKTLLTLIIMALLINFSKPIAIFIFDGSQLLMNFFLSQMGQTGTSQTTSTVVAKASEIANLVYDSLPKYWGSTDTSLNLAAQYLFAVVFLFMLGVAFFVTALMLIIRIVVIMLLIIVSPFAFFAAIVPDFSKMSSQWWSSLFEYSYYGPAAAFFLLLATKLDNALPHLTNTSSGTQFTAQNLSTTVNNIVHYLTVLVFLYASIFMAKKFGGGAGAAIVGNENRFMKWAGGMTKGGGMWGGAARVTGAADVYKGVKQGIDKQPYWRVLTKEGREAKRKEARKKWEGRFAPFDIANVKKKSKEMDGDDISKVNAGIARGDPASILQAASRGKLTAAQLKDPKVRKVMQQYADFEGAVYKNLRDTGNGHVQYEDMIDRGATTTEAFEKTYKDQSFNTMAEKGNLKTALNTEDVAGSTYDIFHKMNKLKDLNTIKNLQARATDADTFNVLQKLHDYRVWENSIPPFSGTPPTGWVGTPGSLGDLSVYLRS